MSTAHEILLRNKNKYTCKLLIDNGISKQELLGEILCNTSDEVIANYITLIRSRKEINRNGSTSVPSSSVAPPISNGNAHVLSVVSHMSHVKNTEDSKYTCNHQLDYNTKLNLYKCNKCKEVYSCQTCIIRELNKQIYNTCAVTEKCGNCDDCNKYVRMYICNMCKKDKLICGCDDVTSTSLHTH